MPKEPTFRALNATKGGLLLSVIGKKTRSFGQNDAKVGDLAYLENPEDPSLRIPVVIDSVIAPKHFSEITEEEATQAGFSSKQALQQRLTFSYLSNGKATANENSLEGTLAFQAAQRDVLKTDLPSVTYHVPSAEELKGFNLSPLDATALVSSTASRVLKMPDVTVDRAFAKAGVPGKNAMDQLLRSAISSHFAEKGAAVA